VSRARGPSGPRGLPGLGNYFGYNRGPLSFLEEVWREHGELSRFPLGPFDVWLVVHPDDVQRVLLTDHKHYHKGPEYKELMLAVGKGLLTSEDALWRRNRKLSQPAFHRRSLIAHAAHMSLETERLLDGWTPGPRALVPDMTALTLRIVARSLFSTELGPEVESMGEAVSEIIDYIDHRIKSPFKAPASWPTAANRRFRASKEEVDGQIHRFVDLCRERGDSGDLLSMLVHARDPDTGEFLDDEQLRDEIVTLFAAGHETTATCLVWTLSLLHDNPAWEARVAEEARSVLGDRVATADDELPVLDRVIKESLRLRPPAWAMGRKPIAPTKLRGYPVPEGALIFVLPWLTHRHPDFWEAPGVFDPDRWLPERSEERHRFAWYPFGGGPRVCIGQGFALLELRIVLATMLARWRIEVPQMPSMNPSITLRPVGPVPAVLHRR